MLAGVWFSHHCQASESRAGVGDHHRGVALGGADAVAVEVDQAAARQQRGQFGRGLAVVPPPRTCRGAGVRDHHRGEADHAATDVVGLEVDQPGRVGVQVGRHLRGCQPVVPPPAGRRVGAAVADHAHGEGRHAAADRLHLDVCQPRRVGGEVVGDLRRVDAGVEPPAGRRVDRQVGGRGAGVEAERRDPRRQRRLLDRVGSVGVRLRKAAERDSGQRRGKRPAAPSEKVWEGHGVSLRNGCVPKL